MTPAATRPSRSRLSRGIGAIMDRLRRGILPWLLTAAPLLAGSAKDCLNLSATKDQEIYATSGIQVTVTGFNRCGDSVNPDKSAFKVKAMGNDGEVGAQTGRFQTSIPPGDRGQTRVFIYCNPDRVRSLLVEGQ